MESRGRLVKELQERVGQYEKEMNEVRDVNEGLYHKCEESGKEVGVLKKDIIGYKFTAEEAVAKADECKVEVQNLLSEKEELEVELGLVRHKLNETSA